MKLNDLIRMYEDKKREYGDKVYLHVSEIFEEARERYKREYLSSPRAARLRAQGKTPDAEQSWKAFKGKNFEKLIWRVIDGELGSSLNLCCIPGGKLGRKKLSPELGKVYRNLLVRYGQWSLLPDTDLVVYDPRTCQVVGIISCKITLRERIAQTAYWKLKLASDPLTMHIKGYFITADEDKDLVKGLNNPKVSRNRIMVEHELDGTYVLREVEESERVKSFPEFVKDIKKVIKGAKAYG